MLRTGLLISLTSLVVGAAITGSSVSGSQARAKPASGAANGQAALTGAPSTAEQLAVSAYLSRRGALFYGAWWCPACTAQKGIFGREGGARLPYVECDRTDDGRQRCMAARIRAYPTWELDGRRLEGVQSVEELKVWSGYPGGGPQAQ